MARKVVLAGACRTAIGTMGGTLSNTPAPDLGTVVIKEVQYIQTHIGIGYRMLKIE